MSTGVVILHFLMFLSSSHAHDGGERRQLILSTWWCMRWWSLGKMPTPWRIMTSDGGDLSPSVYDDVWRSKLKTSSHRAFISNFTQLASRLRFYTLVYSVTSAWGLSHKPLTVTIQSSWCLTSLVVMVYVYVNVCICMHGYSVCLCVNARVYGLSVEHFSSKTISWSKTNSRSTISQPPGWINTSIFIPRGGRSLL